MALSSSFPVLSSNPNPKIIFKSSKTITPIFSNRRILGNIKMSAIKLVGKSERENSSSTKLKAAGLSEIEPDLNEDPVNRWETNSVSADDFIYGEYDGHHTYFEGEKEKGTFWGSIADDIAAVGTPTGFQGIISWLFLPAVAAGMYFNVPGEYIYIGAALFTVIFCIIEMDKPDQPHNFEPQIYNMERGARDKLISDYNTMNIWEFNEKYGELWDFTVNNEDIVKR